MKLDDIDVNKTIERARYVLGADKAMSSPTKVVVEVLITIITILVNRLNLNSSNSSKPPSSDPNRKKKQKEKSKK